MSSGINSLRTAATLPPEVRERAAWYGEEIAESGDWIEWLTEAEIVEVENAVAWLEESHVELASITSNDVSLPTLAGRLRRSLDEVLDGRGFVLIRGLSLDRWTRRQAAIAFLAIGVQLGALRMQNAEGHLLGHVK